MISILCITKLEPHALPFVTRMKNLAALAGGELVLAVDTYPDRPMMTDVQIPSAPHMKTFFVRSEGYLESVLEHAVTLCKGDYILRLDDDEKCSDAMELWLLNGHYRDADHWKFPRANVWRLPKKPNKLGALLTPHLWPDVQTRLSTKAKSGGRNTIHSASPFGGGDLAPVLIEHHKFVVRPLAERLAINQGYDQIALGAGEPFLAFSAPEVFYKGQTIRIIPLNDGRTDQGHYSPDCGGCGKWVTF